MHGLAVTLICPSKRYEILAERMLAKHLVGYPHFTTERLLNVLFAACGMA